MFATDFQITEFSGDTRYATAVAQVRTLEQHLLPFRKFLRLAEKPAWQGVLDELRGTAYYDTLVAVQNAAQLEHAVSQFIRERRQRIRQISIEPRLIDAIALNLDLNNLKIVLKQRWSEAPRPVSLAPDAAIPEAVLKEGLEQPHVLPAPLKDLVPELLQDYEANHSLFRVEMRMAQFYLQNLFRVFQTCGIPFLEHFIRYRIDLTNITQLLRWRQWAQDARIDRELLFAGGYLDWEVLQALLAEQPEKGMAALQYSPYFNALSGGLEHYAKSGEIWLLEKQADDFLTEFCRLTRYTAFGIEPLVSYMWLSLQEMKNIHLVLMAKYLDLDAGMVKNRLRQTYA